MSRITFTPATDELAGTAFTAAPAGRHELLAVGLAFYEASPTEQEAILKVNGSVMIRRALNVFANVAERRFHEPEVAKAAREMRKVIPAHGGADLNA